MDLQQLLQQIKSSPEQVSFDDVMQVIAENYDYTPSAFRNGQVPDRLENPAGVNEGACKIFAFACINGLDQAQTLACFGDYYRQHVLGRPHGEDHANIRQFMRHGRDGIAFEHFPLEPRV